ncbi:MAG: Pilus assembly protein PilO, partial [Verrucomicrobiota bacterium]
MTKPTFDRQRWLLILTGVAVGLLVLDSLVLSPLTRAWQARSAEIARLGKLVADGESIVARGERTRGLWQEMQGQALPADPAKAEQDLLTAFDRWGRAGGVEVASIKPQWKRGQTSQYSLLECRVDVTGPLPAMVRFLHEVEKSPLALRIDSLELNSRDDTGGKLSLGLLVSGLRLVPLEG